MLQNRRRQRFARMMGSMGSSPTSTYEEEPTEQHEEKEEHAIELACAGILAAVRSDDVGLLCRSFKAAYKACEMYDEEEEGY